MQELGSFSEFAGQAVGLLDDATGADVVVFPEYLTLVLLTLEDDWQDLAAPEFRRVVRHTDAYRSLFEQEAVARGQVIVAGSHLLPAASSGGGVRNVTHTFMPDGQLALHAKTTLFPGELDWGTQPGDDVCVVSLGPCSLGVMTCYEAEFPEIPSTLAAGGCEIIACPAFTYTEAGSWRVQHTCAARCIENQLYVACSFLVGDLGGPFPAGCGQSALLTPCDSGFPEAGIAAQAKRGVNSVISHEFDLALLRENRSTGAAPLWRDRERWRHLYSSELFAAQQARV